MSLSSWKSLPFGLLSAAALLIPSDCVYSKPTGFALKKGHASVTHVPEGVLIEAGKSAFVEWQDFSIAREEILRITHAGAGGCLVNRVTGKERSELLGQLLSDGSVFLINPNGILIGKDAYIDTAGFIASTLDLLGEDLSEKTLQFRGSSEESVVNEGKIHCKVGDVFLVGRRVENSGEIITENGSQGLLSGFDVLLQPDHAPKVQIRSEQVMTKDEFAKNPYALAIRHSGHVKAQNVYVNAAEGLSEVSGEIVASGGTVHVLGDAVHVKNEALIDVSHEMGGGEVLIGGDYQGQNEKIKNAKRVLFDPSARVNANSLGEGDGGKVILWGDEETQFYGRIVAEGGKKSGDGGFVEVSGHMLTFEGGVSTLASKGKAGTLLLDPYNMTIGSTDINLSFTGCGGGVNTFFTNSEAGGVISTTTLVGALNSCGEVRVTTAGVGTLSVGNITVSSSFSWSSGNALTLIASNSILVATNTTISGNGNIVFSSSGPSTGNGITLSSGSSVSGNNITFSGISLNGDGIMLSSDSSVSGNNITFNGGSSNGNGILINSANVSANGFALTGTAFGIGNGILVTGSCNLQLASNVSFTGSGGTSGMGVAFYNASVSGGRVLVNNTGNLSVLFQNCTGAGANPGVYIGGSVSILPSGQGMLFINCTGGSGASNGDGIRIGNDFSDTGASDITSPGQVEFNTISGGTGGTSVGVNVLNPNFTLDASFSFTGVRVIMTDVVGASTTGTCYGFNMTGGQIITNDLIIQASALTATTNSSPSAGINFTGGTMSAEEITLTGVYSGSPVGTGACVGINIAGSLVSTGTITLSGSTNGSNTAAYGVSITGAQTWATTGTSTIIGTGTVAPGYRQTAAVNTTGTISITGNGGTLTTTGGGVHISSAINASGSAGITLAGTVALNNSAPASAGVLLTSAGTLSLANGNMAITGLITGTNNSLTTAGVLIAGAITSSGNGAITISGSNSVAGTGSRCHGVSIQNVGEDWVTGNGTVTFINCFGGNATTSQVSAGVEFLISAGTVTMAGPLIFQNCIGGSSATNSFGVKFTQSALACGSLTVASVTIPNTAGGGCAAFSNQSRIVVTGPIVATQNITAGTGTSSIGWLQQATITATGTVNILATSSSTTGTPYGFFATSNLIGSQSIIVSGQGYAGGVVATASIQSTLGSITLNGTSTGTSPAVQLLSGCNVNVNGGSIAVYGTATSNGIAGISMTGGTISAVTPGTIFLSGAIGSVTGAARGISLTGGTITSTGPILLNGVAGTATSSNSYGIYLGGGRIVSTSSTITLIGTNTAGASTDAGIRLDTTTDPITSTSGAIVLQGWAGSTATSAHGISSVISWNAGTTGTVTFQNSQGGTGATSDGVNFSATFSTGGGVVFGTCTSGDSSGSYGVNISGTFSATGSVSFSNITTGAATEDGGAVLVGAPLTIGGALTGTAITTGSGTNNTGWLQNASTAVTGTINIAASSGTTIGTATGIFITDGTMSTAGISSLVLSGEALGDTISDGAYGINITGGAISSAGGAIQLSGNVEGAVPSAIALNATNAIVSATGSIQLSGTATGNLFSSISVNQPWSPGTSATVTFTNVSATSTGPSGHTGVNIQAETIIAGDLVFSNISSINAGTGRGVAIFSTLTISGSLIATDNISGSSTSLSAFGFQFGGTTTVTGVVDVAATANSSPATSNGILVGAPLTSLGASTITLRGTGTKFSGTGVPIGISITGQVISDSGPIILEGTSSGLSTTIINGGAIFLNATNAIVSTSGLIQLSGTNTTTGSNTMHGVHIPRPQSPGTSGTITFVGCSGGTGNNNRGVLIAATFTASNTVVFGACTSGTGSGGAGVAITAPFSASNTVTFGTITTQSSATTANAITVTSPITISPGNLIATQNIAAGAGTSTIGWSSSSAITADAISITATSASLTGTAAGISMTAGTMTASTGALVLTGAVTGTTSTTSLGVLIGGVLTAPGGGEVTLSGTSAATGASSHGVSITGAQTTLTTGTVTFQNSSGGGGSTSHGVNITATFSTQGAVVFGTCTSGTGSGSNGVSIVGTFTASNTVTFATITCNSSLGNVISVTQPMTISPGELIATQAITGGTLPRAGWVSSASVTAGTIAITTTSNSGVGSARGISITGGTMSTTNGPLTLLGFVTGGDGSAIGINIASPGKINAAGTQTITLSGTTVLGGAGLSILSTQTITSTGTVTFQNCQGGNSNSSHGAQIGSAFIAAGPVVFNNCSGGVSGLNGYGVYLQDTFNGSSTVSFTNCTASNANAGIGVNIAGTFTADGTVTFATITTQASTGFGSCIQVATFTTGGALIATQGIITSTGSDCTGWSSSRNITATSVEIAATSASTSGAGHGISLVTGGTITATAGDILLTGSHTGTSSSACNGINNTGAALTSSSGGAITLSGTSNASGANSNGVLISAAQTTMTTGTVTFQNSSGGSGSTSNGVNIGATFSTQGALVFGTITGGSGSGSNGVSLPGTTSATGNITFGTISAPNAGSMLRMDALVSTGGTFNAFNLNGTGTTAGIGVVANNGITASGNLVFSTLTGTGFSRGLSLVGTHTVGGNVEISNINIIGSGVSPLGVVVFSPWLIGGSVTVTGVTAVDTGSGSANAWQNSGSISATGNIRIEAIGTSSTGASTGVNVSGTCTTVGTSFITLIGTASSTTTSSSIRGVSLTRPVTTVSGPITITGNASGTTTVAATTISGGVVLAATNAITSTSGVIQLSGTCSVVNTNGAVHGVAFTRPQTPATSGTITFINCSGGTGPTSHGVFIGSNFTTASPVMFGTLTSGTGSGSAGLAVGATFNASNTVAFGTITTVSGATSASAISVSQPFTISPGSLTATLNIAAGTGSGNSGWLSSASVTADAITITATSASTAGAVNGISITGGTVTASTGATTLTGAVTGASTGMGIGVSILSGQIVSQGTVTMSGTSNATGALSHGVYMGAPLSTPASVVFENSQAGPGNQAAGVYVAGALNASNSLTFATITTATNTTGGWAIALSGSGVTLGGALVATQNITTGSGTNNTGWFSNTGVSASSITVTASSGSTTGTATGVAVLSGTLSVTGTGTIVLTGTGGVSSGSSQGVNLMGGALQSASTFISVSGSSSGSGLSYGVNINGGTIVSTTGSIFVVGTNTSTVSTSSGVSVTTSTWNALTTGTFNFTGSTSASSGFPIRMGGTFSTGGILNFNNSVGIGNSTATIVPITSGGTMTFVSTIDGFVTATNSLTVSSGTTPAVFSANIGVTNPLVTFLVGTASVAQFGSSVATITVGTFTTASAVPMTYATTGSLNMTVTGGATFGSTLNAPGTGNLQITAGTSTVTFNGNVGATNRPGNVVIASGGAVGFGSSVATVTVGSLTITSPVPATFSISGTATVSANTGSLTFGGNLNPATNNVTTLNLNATNGITFGADIGNSARFAGFNINEASILIFTAATHTVNVNNWSISAAIPTSLVGAGTTTINSFGTITFGGTIDGSQNLNLNATNQVQLNGNIGATSPLNTLAVGSGTLLAFGPSVATVTVGTLNITGTIPTTFAAATTTVTTTGSGGITFNGNLNGAVNDVTTLNLSAVGPVTFGSDIGNTGIFNALNINAASVVNFTSGTHTANVNSWVIGSSIPTFLQGTGSTTINSGGAISFGSTINGSQSLTLNATSTVTLNGNIGATTSLATFSIPLGSGASFGSSVGTVTAVNINIAIPTTYSTTGSLNVTTTTGLTFGSTLDAPGTGNLQVIAGTGTVAFNGNVGATNPLGNVVVTTAGAVGFGSSVATVTVDSLTLTSPIPATFSISGTATVGASGTITFGGNLNPAVTNVTTLNLNATNGITFGADIGNSARFAALNINQASTVTFTAGTHTVNVNNWSIGAIPTTLVGAGATTINSGGSITFGSTINGSQSLTLNATNAVTLSGNIGATTALATFSIPLGSVAALGSSIGTVTAANINISVPTTYATTGSLNVTTTTGLTFGSTLNAPGTGNLQVIAGTGTVAFNGNVGATNPPGNVVVTTAGAVGFGSSVATVTVGSLTLASSIPATFAITGTATVGASGAITFGGNLNPAVTNVTTLNLNATNAITFGADIGNSARFAGFNINEASSLVFTATTHTVNVNNWTISSAIPTSLVGAGTTTINSLGTITFGGTIDGSQTLVLNATNQVQLNDDIGLTTPLNTLTVGTASLLSFGANVATVTVGTLNITGVIPTTFAAATTTVTTTGSGGITFTGNLNGAVNNVTTLNLSAIGAVTFGSNIGNTGIFNALNINAASVVNFTSGTHTANVNDWVVGSAIPTVLQGTGATTINSGGTISFTGTVNGAQNLTLNATNSVAFSANVGATTAIGALSVPLGSAVTFGASVGTVSATSVNLTPPVTYAAIGTLNMVATGSITFGSTLDAPGTGDLQLTAGSSGVSFGGNIGVTNAPDNVAIASTGTVSFGASVGTVNLTSLILQGTATTTFAAATTTVTATGASGLTFTGNLSGAANDVTTLNLNTPAGPVRFGADVGVPFTFSALNINDAPSLIFTAGTHTVNIDVFTVGTTTVTSLEGTGITTINAGTISFGNTINGNGGGSYTLVLNTGTGTVALDGNIGNTNSLGALTVTANSTAIGVDVDTITAGTITLTSPVTYAATGTLSMTGTGGITFSSTLDAPGTGHLQLNAGTQTVSFGGNIGASDALGNLLITAGTTSFGASVASVTASSLNVSGSSTFAAATTTITADGANGITFGGNMNGTTVLNLSASNAITFGGHIGNTATFSQFNINDASSIVFTATTHTVNVNNWSISAAIPTSLVGAGTTTINSTGTITFGGTINGSQNLTLNATNNVQLNGNIGLTTPVNTLTVGTASLLSFGASVATVTVGTLNITGVIPTTFAAATTTVTTTGSGGITFNGNLNGASSNVTTLNLSAMGPVTFGSNIGNTGIFNALNINAASSVNFTSGTHTANVNNWVIGSAIPTVLQGTGATTINSGGTISFTGTVNGAQSLTLNATNSVTFDANIGASTALGALSVPVGSAVTLGSSVGTVSATAVSLTPAVTYATTGTLNVIGTSGITFGSTLNAPGTGNLQLSAATGTILFADDIGVTNQLGNLVLVTAGTASFGASVATVNVAELNVQGSIHSIFAAATTTVIANTGSINFNGNVDGTASGVTTLRLNAPDGRVRIGGNVGTQFRLAALLINGPVMMSPMNAGSTTVFTAGTHTINTGAFNSVSPVLAEGTGITTINTNFASGPITFGDTIDSDGLGSYTIVLNAGTGGSGTISFAGNVGGTGTLATLSVTSADITELGSAVATWNANSTSFASPVTFATSGTLTMTTPNGLTFSSTLDAPNNGNLAVTASTSTVSFGGNIGVADAPGTLLISTAGTTTFGASVGTVNVNVLTVTSPIPAVFTAATTNVLASTITFGGNLNGAASNVTTLNLNATNGITFGANVGNSNIFSALNINQASTVFFAAGTNTVNANTLVIGTLSAPIPTVLQGTGTLTVNTNYSGSGNITFNGSINGDTANAHALTLQALSTGTISLNGQVGASTALGTITISSGVAATLGASVTTVNARSFSDMIPTTYATSGTLNVVAPNGISFASTLDAPNTGNVQLSAALGTVSFSANVGASNALGRFNVLTGTTTFGASVASVNALSASFANGVLFQDTGATTITTNGNITFSGTVNGQTTAGGHALTLNAGSGTVTFSRNVGSTVRLGTLSITTGAAALFGGTMSAMTVNAFSTGAAVPLQVTSSSNVTLTTSAANGNISFGSTVDGPSGLSMAAGTGTVTFNANVGANSSLNFLQVTSATLTSFANTATSVTAGRVNISSPVQIAAATTTMTTTGSISFGSTINGVSASSQSLTLSAGGSITFLGSIGTTSLPLGTLTVTAATGVSIANPVKAVGVDITHSGLLSISSTGSMALSNSFTETGGTVQTGANITASNNIHFGSPVTLTATVTMTAGDDITYDSTINGGQSLTSIGDNVTYTGAVGPLSRIATTATGTITVNANQTVTAGPMTYTGEVVVTSDAVFTNSGNGGVTFTESITGNHDVTITAPNTSVSIASNVDLSGATGGSFTVSSGGNTTIGGDIDTRGSGGDGGSVDISSSNGSVHVHNVTTTGTGAAGDITLAASPNATAGIPVGLIILEGNLTGAAITLDSNRASEPMVATIIGNSTYPPGSDLTIQGDSISIGENEAMTIYGDITLDAPSMSLGDIVALESLTIDAGIGGTIDTNLRGTITILDYQGNSVFSPNRHFLSGGSFSRTGNLNPASPTPTEGSVLLSPAEFYPFLIYNGMVLNFDVDQIPVPPVPPPPVIPIQPRMYLLGVASAQLFYSLPIYWQDFPPSYYLRQKVRWKWKEREYEWRLQKQSN